MKQSTLEAIQKAKDDNLIVEMCSTSSKSGHKGKNEVAEAIFGIWASRYDHVLRDALIDLYPPLEPLLNEANQSGEGSFLFVNTAIQSIACFYLGRYNRLNCLELKTYVKPLERGSNDWKKFTKIDKCNELESFFDALMEFGRCANRFNEFPSNNEELQYLLDVQPNANSFEMYGNIYSRDAIEEMCADLETLDCLGNQALSHINNFFPAVGWGDLNYQST